MSAEKRVAVKLTVPQYQKEAWTDHAEALDMTRSEFLATMVQAGRRVFEQDPLEVRSADANPRGNGLGDHVLGMLSADTHRDFDELLDTLADELDAELQALHNSGEIRFSGRHGGFVRAEGNDGDH